MKWYATTDKDAEIVIFESRAIVFDMQLFAAEDEGRTEEPTEKKLREAREKGQVAKTEELPQALVIIFAMITIVVFCGFIFETIIRMMHYYLTNFSHFNLTERSLFHEAIASGVESFKILIPIFVATVIAALIGNIAQVGFQISTHPLKFDLSKIKFDPATMARKIFFSRQIAMNLFKSIFKVVVIGFICYLVIINDFEELIKTPDISVGLAFQNVSIIALKIIIWAAVCILVLSIPDYVFQKREYIESLKMTKQELKEEWKETVGDPHVRARLQEMQRELIMRNMIREVPKADVVVTNPTHFAIAMRYEPEAMYAPMVIAKGVDTMALTIRQIALDNSILIIENRPLAQELYKRVDVGDIIPEDLFYAVSLIYAEVYKKRNYKVAM